MKLSDGSYVPHGLSMSSPIDTKKTLSVNLQMRPGIVIDILFPDDKNNISKKFIEYNVSVASTGNNEANTSLYRNCNLSNLFGQPKNSLVFTLGEDRDKFVKDRTGAAVLLLCIDGQADAGNAIIIGGLTHPDSKDYSSADGQFYDFNFNGINVNINKDGEYEVLFESPIAADGTKGNEKASGTRIKIDKEGRVKISDNEGQSWEIDRVAKKSTWTNGAESIIVDKEGKSISLLSSGDTSSESAANTNIKAGKDVKVEAGTNMESKAGANMKMEAGGQMQMKASNWQVKVSGSASIKASAGLFLNGGTIASLKGTINTIGSGTIPAAGVGISLTQGVSPFLGLPVITQVITGSATVLIGA